MMLIDSSEPDVLLEKQLCTFGGHARRGVAAQGARIGRNTFLRFPQAT